LRFSRDTVWAFVGLVAVPVAFVLMYVFLFVRPPVQPPATACGVACRLQGNQGLIETFAIFVALIAAFIAVYQRSTDHRSLKNRFDYWLVQAVYEAVHNLRHIADAFDGPSLQHAPIYSLRLARALASEPLEGYLRRDERGRRLWDHIDHMVRNDIFLQGRQLLSRPKPTERPATIWLRGHKHEPVAPAEWEMTEKATKYLVEHMLRFIADAVAGYPELSIDCVLWRAWGDKPHCFPLRPLRSLLLTKRKTEFYVRFHATWLDNDQTNERSRWASDVALTPLCWLDDRPDKSPTDATRVLVVGEHFASLGDPPIPPEPRSRG